MFLSGLFWSTAPLYNCSYACCHMQLGAWWIRISTHLLWLHFIVLASLWYCGLNGTKNREFRNPTAKLSLSSPLCWEWFDIRCPKAWKGDDRSDILLITPPLFRTIHSVSLDQSKNDFLILMRMNIKGDEKFARGVCQNEFKHFMDSHPIETKWTHPSSLGG